MKMRSLVSVGCAALVALATAAIPAYGQSSEGGTLVDLPVRRQIPSFDGTLITTNFFPAEAGTVAPTVLFGPGWGGAGATSPTDPTVKRLNDNGYNVLTWDPRGFGTSGGFAQLDWEHAEGRDMSVIIDYVATLPEARLDTEGDPRLGMVGDSYGGGIQIVTAAVDSRVEAIVPGIAWNTITSSLVPKRVYKAGWGDILCTLGTAGTNRVAPEIEESCRVAPVTGTIPEHLREWYDSRGPAHLLDRVDVPTLLVQGTPDTLFPLDEAAATFTKLRSQGTRAKMLWYCGGHGACLTNPGPPGHVESRQVAWLDKYVKGSPDVDTGPLFEYVDQTGTWRGSDRYPLRGKGSLSGKGSGTLAVDPLHTSGTPIAAQPALNAVNIPIESGQGVALGAPKVDLVYRGTADLRDTVVYGQIVDRTTGLVVGNVATPIRVRLDGRPRVARVHLEKIAYDIVPESELVLQITDATALYTGQRAKGSLQVYAAGVRLPLVEVSP